MLRDLIDRKISPFWQVFLLVYIVFLPQRSNQFRLNAIYLSVVNIVFLSVSFIFRGKQEFPGFIWFSLVASCFVSGVSLLFFAVSVLFNARYNRNLQIAGMICLMTGIYLGIAGQIYYVMIQISRPVLLLAIVSWIFFTSRFLLHGIKLVNRDS